MKLKSKKTVSTTNFLDVDSNLVLNQNIFNEAFKKLSEEYQILVILSMLSCQPRIFARQFSICCLLTFLKERNELNIPITKEEMEYRKTEEESLAELYKEPVGKPS